MKPFKEIVQPVDKSKKILRIIAPVEVPVEMSPFALFDEFMSLCEKKGWKCSGGGVQFPDDDPTVEKSKNNEF